MLLCEPISRSTSEEIFNTVDTYIRTKGLDWDKRIGICTEGARRAGLKRGLMGLQPQAHPKIGTPLYQVNEVIKVTDTITFKK